MISHLDHLVLTTSNEMACIDFYTRVMGMALETFAGGTPPVERKAFKFGGQKINLHVKDQEIEPKANAPTPGALDLCFISTLPLAEAIGRLQECQWPIVEGPSCAQAQMEEFVRYMSAILMATSSRSPNPSRIDQPGHGARPDVRQEVTRVNAHRATAERQAVGFGHHERIGAVAEGLAGLMHLQETLLPVISDSGLPTGFLVSKGTG